MSFSIKLFGFFSERPIPVAEYGVKFTVFIDCINRKIGRAYHKVNVDPLIVCAELVTFFMSFCFKVFDAVFESCAERKMTASVFIEQSIEECYFRISYG